MMEKEELYARIEELERELAEERIRRKITEDNSDCALWEYEIASKNMCFPESLEESGIPPTWSSKTIRNRCITGDLCIRMIGRLLMNSAPQWTGAMSIFPMKSDKSVMNRYLSGSVM